MTCQEAERMVTPYINDELAGDELEDFLDHLEGCKSCQEELEIYYMVDVGIRQLDHENEIFNIAGALEHRIEESYAKVSRMWALRILKYAVSTLAAMAVMVTVFLQFRIWFV